MKQWVVYVLKRDGQPFYVGCTSDLKRRLKEHRATHGPAITADVLDTLGSKLEGRKSEAMWLGAITAQGALLINIQRAVNPSGVLSHTDDAKRHLSTAGQGIAKPGLGAKLSAITKGRPHRVTPSGAKSMARTQFKPGSGRFADKSAEEQERLREIRRRNWDDISAEERSRRAVERNRSAWSKRTPEERAAIGRRISEALARKRAAQ